MCRQPLDLSVDYGAFADSEDVQHMKNNVFVAIERDAGFFIPPVS